MCVLIFSPYPPQSHRAHQTGSGRQVISVDPDFQFEQSRHLKGHYRYDKNESYNWYNMCIIGIIKMIDVIELI